ncbi:unnamed protein product [Soboliphyme baturini]|uniref:Protein C10 n=1 Tax=Soboliphyme baturini TaxID=241478 RepID=A0A183IHJ5_9BILA|nr:unnamed protein product [Soboliphyme baturini]
MQNSILECQSSKAYQDSLALCRNDMVKYMQRVYPLLVKIQMEAVASYGFSGDFQGVQAFLNEMAVLENEDQEIKKLNEDIRHLIIPPLPEFR